ncbi:hypothetical protein SLEP1_g14774 [Rubroshorea leprosula]|uniref:Uncharacterized protein n=1 Tax=Rubroshorea leprosula TaxID=152421 RepID=A0AAV5IVU3_9ROSI|nr:hypothetical protein SLEP1_g14774 [Rubroshorea leprosula]
MTIVLWTTCLGPEFRTQDRVAGSGILSKKELSSKLVTETGLLPSQTLLAMLKILP